MESTRKRDIREDNKDIFLFFFSIIISNNEEETLLIYMNS